MHEWRSIPQPIRGRLKSDDDKRKLRQILLMWNTAVHGYQYFKLLCGGLQQFPILNTSPSNARDGLDIVVW